MSAAQSFPTENFLRATRHLNRTKVLAHLLSRDCRKLFPSLWLQKPVVNPMEVQGWMNHVFRLDDTRTANSYILRIAPVTQGSIASRSRVNFEKERFILELLKDCEFTPTLPNYSTGVIDVEIPGEGLSSFGYMVQPYMPFENGLERNEAANRNSILEQLGEKFRYIHKQQTPGFGAVFDEQQNQFSHATFKDFISERINEIEQASVSTNLKRWLASRSETLSDLEGSSTLFHQDILANHGNLLLDTRGNIRGIIDWEFAGSGPALHFELASLVYTLQRDGHPRERIENDVVSFLNGYGISQNSYKKHYAHDVETIVLLKSLSAVVKYKRLVATDGLKKEPWRELFAERATRFLHQTTRAA